MRRRLSRPCYDKFHRCPGWVGGGPKYPRGESRCDGGRIQVDYMATLWKWRFWPCDTCDVLVLPYHASKLSVPWLIYLAKWKIREWRGW